MIFSYYTSYIVYINWSYLVSSRDINQQIMASQYTNVFIDQENKIESTYCQSLRVIKLYHLSSVDTFHILKRSVSCPILNNVYATMLHEFCFLHIVSVFIPLNIRNSSNI